MAMGRGGGYDAFIDKQSEKRKAFGSDTRQSQSVGAQATPASSLSNPQAPSSLGDLMTPSSGRVMQSAPVEDFDNRVRENESFLSDPTTKGQMMQFAITMLGGGSPGSAIAKAMMMPGRMELASQARLKQERELAQGDRRLDLEERGQNITLRGQDLTAKGTPSELMKTIDAAKAAKEAGDMKTYNMLMSRGYQIANEFSSPTGQVTSFDAEGNPTLINVKGGKADLEAQAAMQKLQDQKDLELAKSASVNVASQQIIQAIDNAKNPNLTVTSLGGLINYIPIASESRNVADAIRVITANLTVDQLQAVRDASQHGGAFGNISNYEDQLLASTRAALDQFADAATLRKNVKIAQFMFDTTTMAERARIGQAWAAGKITPDEANNQYQNYMNAYILGPSMGTAKDFSTPPSYIDDPDIKANWGTFLKTNPDELKLFLNPEDIQGYDAYLKSQQGR